jgi:uncharacterized protein (DUF1810 family)
MSSPAALSRFHQAQADDIAGYATALREVRASRKVEHWIWYIFPQLSGLGNSSLARTYGIRDLAEAEAYLQDPVLRGRLLEISSEVLRQLAPLLGLTLQRLLGSEIDVRKLVSSLTLFRAAARRLYESAQLEECGELTRVADEILRLAASEGWRPCESTLARLKTDSAAG